MNGVDGEVTRAARRVVRGGLTRLRIDDDKTIATASGSANVDPPVAGVDRHRHRFVADHVCPVDPVGVGYLTQCKREREGQADGGCKLSHVESDYRRRSAASQ